MLNPPKSDTFAFKDFKTVGSRRRVQACVAVFTSVHGGCVGCSVMTRIASGSERSRCGLHREPVARAGCRLGESVSIRSRRRSFETGGQRKRCGGCRSLCVSARYGPESGLCGIHVLVALPLGLPLYRSSWELFDVAWFMWLGLRVHRL